MRSDWLTDKRGAPYGFLLARQAGAVAFHLWHQDAEGRLWRRICNAAGEPVPLAFDVALADVVKLVAVTHGAVQLVPVDVHGRGVGTPPEMVILAAE